MTSKVKKKKRRSNIYIYIYIYIYVRRRKRVVLKKSLCAAIRNNNFCASRGATRKMKNTMFLILMIYKIMIYEIKLN